MKLIYGILILSFMQLSFIPNCNTTGIKKTWLTSKRQFAGIIRMNEDGSSSKGSWMTHNIFVELANDNEVRFDSVKFDNKYYTISASKFENQDYIAGKKLSDSSTVIIKPKSKRTIKLLSIQNMDFELDEIKYDFTIYGTKNGEVVKYNCKIENVNLLFDLVM